MLLIDRVVGEKLLVQRCRLGRSRIVVSAHYCVIDGLSLMTGDIFYQGSMMYKCLMLILEIIKDKTRIAKLQVMRG